MSSLPAKTPPPKRTFVSSVSFAERYVRADFFRNSRSYRIGIITVAIAVLAMSVIESVVSRVGLVFLRLGELNVGENDMIIRSNFVNGISLNETWVTDMLGASANLAVGSTPRWAIPAFARSRVNEDAFTDAYLFLMDSEKEDSIDLGRAFRPRLLNEQEAYISRTIADRLGVRSNAGDRIFVDVPVSDLTGSLGVDLSQFSNITALNTTQQTDAILAILGLQPSQQVTVNIPIVDSQQALEDTINGISIGGINITSIINATTLEQLILDNQGSTVIQVTGNQIASLVVSNFPTISNVISNLQDLRLEAIVLDAVESPDGKWPSLMGNVVVMDSKYLPALLDNVFENTPALQSLRALRDLSLIAGTALIPGTFTSALERPNEYAFTITVQYKDRINAYQKKRAEMLRDVIKFSDSVYETLGVDFDGENYVPLATYLNTPIPVLFRQSFLIIDIMIIILACLLIYNLMLDNIADKVYEYGMIRALGLLKTDLSKILVFQALVYAIPGTGFGLVLGVLVFLGFGSLIASQASVDFPEQVPFAMSAGLLGLGIGIAIPLFSNLLLVRTAMSSTLRDALDITTHALDSTKVTVVRLQNLGISGRVLSFGVACFAIGFVSYYLFPYALLYQDYDLAFGILTVIIIGMVLGLASISMALQSLMETGLSYVLILWFDAPLRALVRKNLGAHRSRNHKTAVIFTLSLAFIVFGTAMRMNQQNMIFDAIKSFYGADIRLTSDTTTSPLNVERLTEILEREKGPNGVVADYSFATYPLRQTNSVSDSKETNLGGNPTVAVEVIGVQPNLLNTLDLDFFEFSDKDPRYSYRNVLGSPDVVRSLYETGPSHTAISSQSVLTSPLEGLNPSVAQKTQSDVQGVIDKFNAEVVDVIASESVRLVCSLSTSTLHLLRNEARRDSPFVGSQVRYSLLRSRAFVKKMAGFSFSGYRGSFRGDTSLLVPIPAYERMLKNMQNASMVAEPGFEIQEDVKYKDLYIRVKSGASDRQIDFLENTVKNAVESTSIRVLVIRSTLRNLNVFTDFVGSLFNLVLVVALILCFFSLFLSVYGNVRENSWEYGVLRSLGLSVRQLFRVYIYEANCVIFSAIINGTITGLIITYLLSLFTTIWTENPLRLTFNVGAYIGVILAALAITFIAVAVPLSRLNRIDIALVLRGADIDAQPGTGKDRSKGEDEEGGKDSDKPVSWWRALWGM